MAVNRDDYASILEQAANRVPYWARNTNPIVRRHMGFNWRTVPPELRPLLTGVGIWSVILLIGTVVPLVQSVTMILLLASWIIMPIAWLAYGHILITVAIRAADITQEERRNNTMQLLMATPMSLQQIFLGKVAASLWRRMDDLFLVAMTVVMLAPPMLFASYNPVWPLEDNALLAQLILIIGLVISLLRVILEPIMIGTLAVLVGVVVPNRSTAITTTLVLGAFYFLLMYLVRRLPGVGADPMLIFWLDFILPLALPLALTFFNLWAATRIVTAD